MKTKKSQQGIAFLITVILLGIIVLICVGLSVVIFRDIYTVKEIRYAHQAYFLAEAGAERAIQQLYDQKFDPTKFTAMTDVPLGAGKYTVTLNKDKYNLMNKWLVLITSEGEVKNVSRTVRVLVRKTTIEAFEYSVLSGGRVLIKGGAGDTPTTGLLTGIYDGAVRSNSLDEKKGAVQVGGKRTTGYVEEHVWACGLVKINELGQIDGDVYVSPPPPDLFDDNGTVPFDGEVHDTNDISAVPLPPFGEDFFDYYKTLAINGGIYHSGSATFTDDITPTNGVCFVRGNAKIEGTVTLTGCLVATKKIIINPSGYRTNTFTHILVGSYPSLMSQKGDIKIESEATINGLIYAGKKFETKRFPSGRQIIINGAVIAVKETKLQSPTTINFVRRDPPGVGGVPLKIVCWSE